ncbi:hypothetical protein [Cupriavidus necator]|uniref:hypothetical protein n=1 Tax=Cupriavidus necator TaxID=106590 RepID=UPI003F738C7B
MAGGGGQVLQVWRLRSSADINESGAGLAAAAGKLKTLARARFGPGPAMETNQAGNRAESGGVLIRRGETALAARWGRMLAVAIAHACARPVRIRRTGASGIGVRRSVMVMQKV